MIKAYMGHTLPTAYYRMVQFAKAMNKQGEIEVQYSNFDGTKQYYDNKSFEALIANASTRRAISEELGFLHEKVGIDIWVFQKFFSCWGLSLIDVVNRFYKKPVIVELDDYIFNLSSDHPNYDNFKLDSENIRAGKNQLEICQAVIVSTDYLKEQYKDFNSRIFVIPNSIDFKVWDKLTNKTKKTYINIGWEGGTGHDRDLAIIGPAIKEILKKHKNVKFTLLGDSDCLVKDFAGEKRVRCKRKWIPVKEFPAYLAKQGFDITLAPLADSMFNRGKSNLRWLEASALKIPVIASDVGPYKDTNALKATTTEEWVAQIERLIKSKAERHKIGAKGYSIAKKRFNMVDTAKKYKKILEEVHEGWQKGLKK